MIENQPCSSCGHRRTNKLSLFSLFFYFIGSIFCFVGSGMIIGTMTDEKTWGLVVTVWFGASILFLLGFELVLSVDGSES